MNTTQTKTHSLLLKRFHTLCSRLGYDADTKAQILTSYGVGSSTALSAHELEDVCTKLQNEIDPSRQKADKWRKRLMASIGGWLKMLNKPNNAEHIKAVACRAAGVDSFNKIPTDRLRNLYYAFVNKQKDFKAVSQLTADEIQLLSTLN